ncbi:MAG TPA: methyltransferase domain-containing protein [Caulobacteraceae bacterium]|nr:methyltransferase domain-containing protein [Caulobacteraceae bacterium]
MNRSHWEFCDHWTRLGPPLRPDADVTAAVARAVDGAARQVLQLGVTAELAEIGERLIAVDRSEAMLAQRWPGDTPRRRVVRGDWLSCPFAPASFSAAIGDGSFNCLVWPDQYEKLLNELVTVLSPAGRIVVRAYLTPEPGESISAVLAAAAARRIGSFHAFKWRMAMAAVAQAGRPNLCVQSLRDLVVRHYPDRAALAEMTGWPREDIDTIDVYDGSAEVYSFPTFAEFSACAGAAWSEPSRLDAGAYELAERCPLIILERR